MLHFLNVLIEILFFGSLEIFILTGIAGAGLALSAYVKQYMSARKQVPSVKHPQVSFAKHREEMSPDERRTFDAKYEGARAELGATPRRYGESASEAFKAPVPGKPKRRRAHHRLPESLVESIKAAPRSKRAKEVAAELGVCANTVHRIRSGASWADGKSPSSSLPRGARRRRPKLTVGAVKFIRRALLDEEYTQAGLAYMHGVHVSTIHAITSGRTWRDVEAG